jgi:RNA polymerase sigma factor (sigma-70 family)
MDFKLDTDSDKELLRRFVDHGEEAAFGSLVERHAAMVRGVALRCTGDAATSDEVTQSVFFLLARRAASVPADHLGGWLHRTAFLTARNARRNSLRYKQALRELGQHHDVMTDTSNSNPHYQDAPWEAIHPYLDEAVARLPERARQPVMMRFFESRSIRDIATLTGASEAAVRKILERSLNRLSALLRRRGVATNGTALGVILSAHSLLTPPASAAAVAASALSASNLAAAAAGPALLLSGPLRFFGSPSVLKGAGVALLLAAVPAAMLWRQNRLLQQDLKSVSQSMRSTGASPLPLPPMPEQPAAPVVASTAEAPPQVKAASLPDKNSPAALKEKSDKEAARELTRMSLYLKGLTEDQRTRLSAVLAERSLRRAEAFEQARQSGALVRLAGGMQNVTVEDKALFYAMSTTPDKSVADSDPLKAILSEEQYSVHLEAMERRRVNDAEGAAFDMLRGLGQTFDLGAEQEDAIFQAVAQFELTPRDAGPDAMASLPFGGGPREEERDRIIRSHLSPEQAELFDQRREDDRRRREHLLQSMQPAR